MWHFVTFFETEDALEEHCDTARDFMEYRKFSIRYGGHIWPWALFASILCTIEPVIIYTSLNDLLKFRNAWPTFNLLWFWSALAFPAGGEEGIVSMELWVFFQS